MYAYRSVCKHYLDKKKKKILLTLFLSTSALASLSGIIALYTGFNPLKGSIACHPTRACGLFGMYMTYGYGIGFLSIMLGGVLLHWKKFSDAIAFPILLPTFLLSFAGLFLSYARGAWIGFMAALPFIFFKNLRKFLLALLAVLITTFFIFFSSNKVQNVFTNPQRLNSNQIRLSLWQTAFHSFKERPLLGLGYLNFEPQSKKIKTAHNLPHPEFAGHAHNNFIEYLASTGIFGLSAILLFHLFWFLEMFKRNDRTALLIPPLCVSLFISGQFQYTLGDGENLFFIMTVWALSQVDQ